MKRGSHGLGLSLGLGGLAEEEVLATYTGVVARLSLVNGVAFVDVPAGTIPFAIWRNRKIAFTAGGKTLIGYIGAVGDGEDLGDELITAWSNSPTNPFETLTVNANGHDIDAAVNSVGLGVAPTPSGSPLGAAGGLYKWVYDVTLNSGTAPAIGTTNIYEGAIVDFSQAAAPDGDYYITFSAAHYLVMYVLTGVATNFSATHSLKQVTGPSATGALIFSSRGGATQNWLSNDGINPNSASFTATIYV